MSEYIQYEYHDDEDNYAHHYVMPNLLKLLKGKSQTNILDLGCGNGALDRRISESGFNGTDTSFQGIAIAKKFQKDQFFFQDLSSNELPQELHVILFKTIISIEVIEHLYHPDEFIAFCKIFWLKAVGRSLSFPHHIMDI